jgi:hypothetical protein
MIQALCVLILLSTLHAAEPIQTLPSGEVIFSGSGLEKTAWDWKPTRWGMYDVILRSRDRLSNVEVQIGTNLFGQREVFPPQVTLGRFYLSKADPNRVMLSGGNSLHLVPAPEGKPIVQKSNEPVLLHARDATIHGVTLRYEPQTNKICMGYWVNPSDYPSWDFNIQTPGKYEIFIAQGCGKGQGGSEATVVLDAEKFPFVVAETGHFQNFTNRMVGLANISASGTHILAVKPSMKKAGAIMDIRQVELRPVKP